MTVRREIRFEPGFDHRADPDKKKYGCHGMTIRFLLHAPKATVQFVLYTGWLPEPPLTWNSTTKKACDPIPWDLGYHALAPQYEGHTPMKDECEFTKGPCYYDGSSLNAIEPYGVLVTDGEEALWKWLEEYYNAREWK